MGRLSASKYPGEFLALRLPNGGELILVEVVAIERRNPADSVRLRIHAPQSVEVALGGERLREMTQDVEIEPGRYRPPSVRRRERRKRAEARKRR
jgi:hypothetical protein